MKSQKSNVCYQHIGKCLALVFCGTVFVSWWRVYLLASSCLNWCLVEHSSVKIQTHLLICPFLTHLLSHNPPYPPTHPPRVPVLVLARMFTMSSFSFCVINSELFSLSSFLPPFRSLCKVYITMVLFIQYSVTCLCKFGLEKINLFMRQSVLGTAHWFLLCWCCGVKIIALLNYLNGALL